MSKRICITGAGGFLGCHLLIHLLHNTDYEIIVIDSFRHRGKTDRIAKVVGDHPQYWPRVKVVTHDLVAPFSTQLVRKLGKIDYLISLASESHVDRSIESPRDFIENNIGLMLTLLDYTRENPVEKFIQISTDEVYGPAYGDHDHTEGEPHRPSNPYSASKACQESICFSYWRTYGLPIIIVNSMNLFGELQDPEKLIPRTIQCLKNDTVMPIFANADKTAAGTRKYLHARNLASALLFILNNVKPNKYGDTYEEVDFEYSMQPKTKLVNDLTRLNVVGDSEISNLDVALLVAEYYGKPLKYEMVDFHSERPGHDFRYSLDGSKLAHLGWKTPMDFKASLKTTVEWMRDNPEWLL